MKNIIAKFAVVVVLILLSSAGRTNAGLSDIEVSEGNNFRASSLDLELRGEDGGVYQGKFYDEERLMRDVEVEKSVEVVNAGELGVEYWAEFEFVQGEEQVCGEMSVVVESEEEEVYIGTLSDLNTSTQAAQLNSGEGENWEFSLMHENEDVELQGENCEFDIVFYGYGDAGERTGFSDKESLVNSVTISYEAELEAEYVEGDHTFSFALSDLDNFQSFTYSLNFESDTVNDEVSGVVDLSGESVKQRDILLGTCSDTCTYYPNPHNFELEINLHDVGGHIHYLSESL